MSLLRWLIIPVVIGAVAAIYWFMSYEAAGTAMLVVFGLAMLLMVRILLPTADDVGPTAPVDPEWHERS
jgi:hypothetical protein